MVEWATALPGHLVLAITYVRVARRRTIDSSLRECSKRLMVRDKTVVVSYKILFVTSLEVPHFTVMTVYVSNGCSARNGSIGCSAGERLVTPLLPSCAKLDFAL